MIDITVLKDAITHVMPGSGFGIIGLVLGLATKKGKMTRLIIFKYALTAAIFGSSAFYMAGVLGYKEYSSISAIVFGCTGFFILQGTMILLQDYSMNPIKGIKNLKRIFKKGK